MDEPEIPSNKGKAVGIALALVVTPAALYLLLWSLLKSNYLGEIVLFWGPVICGIPAGILLSRSPALDPLARLVTVLVQCTACVMVSLIIAFGGCSMVNPWHS